MFRTRSGLVLPKPYDPDDLESLTNEPVPYGIWFRCPLCGHRYRSNLSGEGAEPCCTGPNYGLDEHELTVMVRVRD